MGISVEQMIIKVHCIVNILGISKHKDLKIEIIKTKIFAVFDISLMWL